MPYRAATPVRVYELRSDRSAMVVALISTLLGVIALIAVGYIVVVGGPGFIAEDPSLSMLLLCLLVVGLLPVASWYGLRNAQVAGGSAQLQLFERSVLVPPPFGGPATAFSFDGLELYVRRFEGRFMFQTVSSMQVLRFRGGGKVRSLTSRTFESPRHLQELVEDIEALSQGAPLPERVPSMGGPDPRSVPDEYDNQLDAELDRLG